MHRVKCKYCNQYFDRDKEPFIQVSAKRYAHKECPAPSESEPKPKTDKENLEEYIMKLFNITFIGPKIRKQIKQYVEEYNYSYLDIQRSLTYFYEVKGNSIEKANGGIGIVPYTRDASRRYYYALWEAQQVNNDKVIEEYVPIVKEVIIPSPKRQMKKRNLF